MAVTGVPTVSIASSVAPLRPAALEVEALLPAAGRGRRLGATVPKFLYEVGGRAILSHLAERLLGLVSRLNLVVSPDGLSALDEWPGFLPLVLDTFVQEAPTGMADAVLAASSIAARRDPPAPTTLVIVWGDQLGLRSATIGDALTKHCALSPRPAMTLPVVEIASPYVHYATDEVGRVTHVLQQREGDAMPSRGVADCGCFIAEVAWLFPALVEARAAGLLRGARTGEQNFLPVIPLLSARGVVQLVTGAEAADTVGINTPADVRRVVDAASALE